MEAVTRANATHYTWGDACDGWVLVDTPGLSVIEERMPPGTAEHPHRHLAAQQFFRILEGEALMDVPGQTVTLGAGEGLSIPAALPHRIRNQSTADVRFLVISQPSTKYGDRENLDSVW